MLHKTLPFLLLLFIQALNAQTIYVKVGATGNGSSWSNAAGDLAAVLNNATAGTQVWVAAGTYRPLNCNTCSVSQRQTSFVVKNEVKVYGGFVGNETSLNQRTFTPATETILSGDINQDGGTLYNSFAVVKMTHVNANTLLDGFTIRDGRADNALVPYGNYQNSGAGIFIDGDGTGNAAHPTIRNCYFTNNHANAFGGAIYVKATGEGATNLVLEDCSFELNRAVKGAAVNINVELLGLANFSIANCTFNNNAANINTASDGGALTLLGIAEGHLQGNITNCSFTNNTSEENGGAVSIDISNAGQSNVNWTNCVFNNNEGAIGGAIYCDSGYEGIFTDDFLNCTYESNLSNLEGGAMYINASVNGVANYSLKYSVFKNNHAVNAGAALFNNAQQGLNHATIEACKFITNSSDTYAGAMYNFGKEGDCSPTISNCLFVKNTAYSCGAVYNLGSEGGNADPIIRNCTFYGNHADLAGGAIYSNANDSTGNSSPQISNCIFLKNTAANGLGQVLRNVFGSPTISNCMVDVASADSLNNGPSADITVGGGMIYNGNTFFIDTAAFDFHIASNSQAKDAGNNLASLGLNFDLDSNARVYNTLVDMGAYEYSPAITLPYIVSQLPATTTLCQGSTLQFSITAGGTPPLTYTWKLNDVPVAGAANAPTLTLTDIGINQSGIYTCTVADANNLNAVFSNGCNVTVNPTLVPSIQLTVNDTNPCEQQLVTANVQASNQGTEPVYNWYINNVLVGPGSTSWSINAMAGATQIYATLLSSAECLNTTDPVSSNTLTIIGQSQVTPSLTISTTSTVVTANQGVTFNASAAGGGSQPQFQWYLNGNAIDGATFSSWTNSNWADGDQVYCEMIGNSACATTNSAVSNTVEMEVTNSTSEFIKATLVFYPNPVQAGALLNIEAHGGSKWQLYAPLGQKISEGQLLGIKSSIEIPQHCVAGLYFLLVSSEDEQSFQAVRLLVR